MKMNDIEFLMYAMNCVNSDDKSVVKEFRQDENHVKRLAELVGEHGDEVFKKIDEIRGLTDEQA
jgi:hypothetical protein